MPLNDDQQRRSVDSSSKPTRRLRSSDNNSEQSPRYNTRSAMRKTIEAVEAVEAFELDEMFHSPIHLTEAPLIEIAPGADQQRSSSSPSRKPSSGESGGGRASANLTQTWGQLRGDRANVFLLLFLYVLQGIPLGLAGSVAFILSARHVTYHEQAKFSLVFWPFSLKLFWAPIVDHWYWERFGRRKSWLVPTQYLIGLFMIALSWAMSTILDEQDASNTIVNVSLLASVFFFLNFLASVQDIAVDGWALTMLQRRNIGFASTCNSIGQTAGYFIGNILFLALNSPAFCNRFLRDEPMTTGVVTLGQFLYFWGIVFVIATTLVAVVKREGSDENEEMVPEAGNSIVDAYVCLINIARLPAVRRLAFVLLTAKVAFAASESVGPLKLVEYGVQKEVLALIGSLLVPLQILMPVIISRHTSGPAPMDLYLRSYPYRLCSVIVFAVVVALTPYIRNGDGSFSIFFYGLLLVIYAAHQVALYCMFVAAMAFFSRVSDPRVGGTYMTLLNTLSNLGGVWPATLLIELVDKVTWRKCELPVTGVFDEKLSGSDACRGQAAIAACTAAGGECVMLFDGFLVEVVVCVLAGVVWLYYVPRVVRHLGRLGDRGWRTPPSRHHVALT